jgi:hypothetical protein
MRHLGEAGTEAQALAFSLVVTEHTSRGIAIQTVFDNPGAVSALGNDKMTFVVKEPSVFVSAETLESLDAKDLDSTPIEKVMPPQIVDAN